jgi:hypothetical protein
LPKKENKTLKQNPEKIQACSNASTSNLAISGAPPRVVEEEEEEEEEAIFVEFKRK